MVIISKTEDGPGGAVFLTFSAATAATAVVAFAIPSVVADNRGPVEPSHDEVKVSIC